MDINKYKAEYNKENYSRITLYVSANEKEAIQRYCSDNNVSVSSYIKNLISKEIGETYKPTDTTSSVVDVYFVITPDKRFVVASCNSKYMIFYPVKDGSKFGVYLHLTTAPKKLSDKLRKRKMTENSFNKMEKNADVIGEYNKDIPDIESLMRSLNSKKHFLIYSSDYEKDKKIIIPRV